MLLDSPPVVARVTQCRLSAAESRPFLLQLLTDGLLAVHALLKSLGLIPLSNTRIRGLTSNSAANWPHIEFRNLIRAGPRN